MYSPKISEDLIPVLYRIGKAEGKPMTLVVADILRTAISEKYSEMLEEIDPERKAKTSYKK